jgi:hypothetical protein
MLGSTIGISVGQAIWSGVSRLRTVRDDSDYLTILQVLRKQISKISNLTLDLSGAALADSIRIIQTIQVL